MTVNNHNEQGKDLPERVELVRAALPNADRAGSSRNWTERWIQPGRPGTCGRSLMSSRPGIESCSPASTAVPDGRRPRRDCAAAKSRSGRPNRWTSRTRSPDTSAEPCRAAHCLVVHHQAQPEFSELATPYLSRPKRSLPTSHRVLTRWPLLGQSLLAVEQTRRCRTPTLPFRDGLMIYVVPSGRAGRRHSGDRVQE
jgi:hypothetical protein